MNIAEKVKILLTKFRVPERRQAAPERRQAALVHDQASNMLTAGSNLRERNDALFSVVCAPHRLQNTIKAGLQILRVSNLLASARKIITHFKHSAVGMEAIHARDVARESILQARGRHIPTENIAQNALFPSAGRPR